MCDVIGAIHGQGDARIALLQELEFAQGASTDAITWSIGARHSLDMVTIEGAPSAAAGSITTNLAHVLRVEHQ